MTRARLKRSSSRRRRRVSRLDRVLAARVGDLSRSRLKALIVDGRVSVCGRSGSRSRRCTSKLAQRSSSTCRRPSRPSRKAETIPLDVVYEDAAIIVINKPAGLVVHPAAGHASGTLVNALIAHCGASLSGIGGVKRPGIVHRLDKDTTGVMIAAKTDEAHKSLTKQFADHGRTGALRRAYVALVWGAPKLPSGVIDLPIDRHRTAREKMAVRKGGREAITHWQLIETICRRGQRAGRHVPALRARDRAHASDPRAPRRTPATRCSATMSTVRASRPRRRG